jgi:transposase
LTYNYIIVECVAMKVRISYARHRHKDKIYKYPLLVHSYRDEEGMPRNKTIANLSKLPPYALDALDKALKGGGEVSMFTGKDISYERSIPIGHVWALYQIASDIEMVKFLDCIGKERKIMVLSMIFDRVLSGMPHSKRALCDVFPESSLAWMLKVKHSFKLSKWYKSLEVLYNHQTEIQKQLYTKVPDRIYLYDITSSYFEGTHCPLAEFGYSRDKKKGKKQILIGLMTDSKGCPIAVEVFKGNTSDQTTVMGEITKLREEFGVKEIIFIGDRGMVTSSRIAEIEAENIGKRIDYITALQRCEMMEMVEDKSSPLQLELFDEKNLAEVRYKGRRYILCHSLLRKERDVRTREQLMCKTEERLLSILRNVQSGRIKRKEVILKRVYRWINKWGMERFYKLEIEEGKFHYEENEEELSRYKRLDGCYVIVTSVDEKRMKKEEVQSRYKSLSQVEQAFRTMKTDDLHTRPIRHWNEARVRGHVFMCMLSYRLVFEARKRLSGLLVRDIETRYTSYGSLREIWESLEKVTIGRFRIAGKLYEQLGNISERQRKILKVLGVVLNWKRLSRVNSG